MEEIKGSRIPLLIEDLVFEDDFVVDIAAGYTHCLALTLKRRVFIWGQKCNYPPNKSYEEGGLNIYTNHQFYPKELRGILIHYSPKKVIAGAGFSGVITTDGKLLTFGIGFKGQLGHLNKDNGVFEYLFEPKRVDFFDDYFVDDASFGSNFALAIVRKKTKDDKNSEDYKLDSKTMAFAWGENKYGQCGSGDYGNSLTPRRVKGLDDYQILQVSAGDNHSLILAKIDDKESLFCCGSACKGATGLTKNLKGCFPSPTIITILDKCRKIKESDKLSSIVNIHAGNCTSQAIISSAISY